MYKIRKAEITDVDFITDVIINAEKSMTNTLGLAKIFMVSENDLRNYLISMLNEEVDGCEYSISSFFIASYKGDSIGALGGWLEGHPDGISSNLLKSNLIGVTFPRNIIINAQPNFEIIKPLQYDKVFGAYQIEYAYIDKKHRGIGIPQDLMNCHIEYAKKIKPDVNKVQVQPFENNEAMIKVHEYSGFKIVKRFISDSPDILNYVPYHSKVLMEKEI